MNFAHIRLGLTRGTGRRIMIGAVLLMCTTTLVLSAQGQNAKTVVVPTIHKAVEDYDRAFQARDLDALEQIFSADVVMYEQGTQNQGRQDVLTNHLGPELRSFQDLAATYSDQRILESEQMAIVTRNFSMKGKKQGRPFFIRGTETQGWQLHEGRWELAHIHLSFPPSR